jgi:hypothetical protein
MYVAFTYMSTKRVPGDPRVRMYAEEISASEVDVSSLSFSFLLTQVIRYQLAGVLPGMFGGVMGEPDLNYGWLYFIGVFLFFFSLVLVDLKSWYVPPQEEDSSSVARFLNIVSAGFGMCCAWCSFYATHSVMMQSTTLREHGVDFSVCPGQCLLGRCFLALVLSVSCIGIIWLMSAIEKGFQKFMKFLPYGADIVLRIVTIMSVLLGFAWVTAFRSAIVVVSDSSPRPGLTVVGLVGFTLLVMLPAWQKFIVPKTMILHAYHLRRLAGESQGRQSGLA